MSYRLETFLHPTTGRALALAYFGSAKSPMVFIADTETGARDKAEDFYRMELERQKKLAGLTEERIAKARAARERARAKSPISPEPSHDH